MRISVLVILQTQAVKRAKRPIRSRPKPAMQLLQRVFWRICSSVWWENRSTYVNMWDNVWESVWRDNDSHSDVKHAHRESFVFLEIPVNACRVLANVLTRHAGDQRLLPLAAWLAFDHRIQFLHKTVLTVVPDLRVGLIAHPPLPKHLGEGNPGGLAAGRC